MTLQEVTWADCDKNGRILYAQDSNISSTEFKPFGELRPQELADFNSSESKQ
jgi:hypothetical protein